MARTPAELPTTGTGLTSAQAQARLSEDGPNSVGTKAQSTVIAQVGASLANPLVLVLLGAAGVSAGLGNRIDAVIIVVIVLLSLALDVVQSFRSGQAVKKLQSSVAPTATVMRDGTWVELPREMIVVGDVVRLTAGDLVPADGRLLEVNDLHVNEAALTGESLPVEKSTAPDPSQPNASAAVSMGTSVVSGSGIASITATGGKTQFGDIAAKLLAREPETEFQRGMRQFGLLITRTVGVLSFGAFLILVALHRPALESLMFSVALAVGLTPEFLPMITSITLARGAVRMARHKVIVKNLASIQNLGSMDVLCSDKTGTLTTGEMELERSVDPEGKDSQEPLRLGALNAANETGIASPLDAAILAKHPADPSIKLSETPFDFERRMVSIVARPQGYAEGKAVLVCKGAPESVVAACSLADRALALETADKLGQVGYRVLAVAWKEVPATPGVKPEETGLVLAGFLAFADPPLPDALRLLEQLKHFGVEVKVITGDSEPVAAHVCTEIGLEIGHVVTGEELDRTSDLALPALAEKTRVFARVSPAQKNRIILAVKAAGHVVGYMGDGINDAPSLRAADVGISFKSGTDVARDAADIVLTERGLGVLHRGVLEGRMAFGNVMKYLLMGTSSNFGNMFSMAGASAFLPFLPMLPTQILLNNFLYDFAQITIPTDHVDRSFILKTRRWDMRLIRDFMLLIGPVSSLFDFLTFWVLLALFHAGEKEFHTGWFVESLATQTLVIFVIRTRLLPWKSRPSRPLAVSTLLVVAVASLLPYTPLARPLGFTPLPAAYFGFLGVMVLAYLALVEIAKRWVMKRLPESY